MKAQRASQPEKSWSADEVMARLLATTFAAPAHAVLKEVRDTTGYAASRSADALVVSLWPSRGVWFAGVEVKVSRGDWTREVKNPAKSTEVQQYCDYWWVATPPGIVRLEELPKTWGLIEVTAQRNNVIVAAPKLEPVAQRPGFIAAVLRNRADAEKRLVDKAVYEALQAVKEDASRYGSDELKLELAKLRQTIRQQEVELAQVAAFEKASGLSVRLYGGARYGAEVALARKLVMHSEQLQNYAAHLAAAAQTAREAATMFAALNVPGKR